MKKKWYLAIGSSLLTLLLVFAVIETYYWHKKKDDWVAKGLQFDTQLGWVNIPRLEYSDQGRQFTHNSQGFRSPEPDNLQKQILLVGDSVTYGTGLNDNETIASFLVDKFPERQILNLGVNGFGIDQYYLLLDRHLENLNPSHVVVVVYTGNDLLDMARGDLSGIGKPFFFRQEDILVNLNHRLSRFDCTPLWSRSFLGSLVGRIRIINSFCHRHKMKFSEAKILAKTLLLKTAELIQLHGAKAYFVLSPARTAVEWAFCALQRAGSFCKESGKGFQGSYDLFREILEQSSLRLLDFENELLLKFKQNIDGLTGFYNFGGRDIHHFGPKGTQLMAKAIALRLKATPLSDEEELGMDYGTGQLKKTDKFFIERARALFKEDRVEDALQLLEKNLQPTQLQADGYFLLGQIYDKIGEMEKSIIAFRLLVRLNPERALAYNLLGAALVKAKNFKGALGPLDQAVEISPDYADSYFNLAIAFEGLNQGKKALGNLLLAQRLYMNQENKKMYDFAGHMVSQWEDRFRLDRNKLNEFLPTAETLAKVSDIGMLRRRLKNSPNNIYWRQRLGSALMEISDFEEAVKQYKKVIEIFPQNQLAYNAIGYAQIKQGRYKNALFSFERALKINPEFAEAHVNLGTVLDFLKNKEGAFEHIREARRLAILLEDDETLRLAENRLTMLSKKYKSASIALDAYRARTFGR